MTYSMIEYKTKNLGEFCLNFTLTSSVIFQITAQNPGSELAAETAAALAAASIIFKEDDPTYSALCLRHAKELYNFADQHRGVYSDSIPEAAKFYGSSSRYNDELAWGAIWLYRATGDDGYLNKAEQISNTLGNVEELSWDNKAAGVQILLGAVTEKQVYKDRANQFCTTIFNRKPKTQDGK